MPRIEKLAYLAEQDVQGKPDGEVQDDADDRSSELA